MHLLHVFIGNTSLPRALRVVSRKNFTLVPCISTTEEDHNSIDTSISLITFESQFLKLIVELLTCLLRFHYRVLDARSQM